MIAMRPVLAALGAVTRHFHCLSAVAISAGSVGAHVQPANPASMRLVLGPYPTFGSQPAMSQVDAVDGSSTGT